MMFVLGIASGARAQPGAPNDVGFQPNRDYLALQPWEAIDTSNNNVILTFTDLALPGNAKRELRFERVFSNVIDPLDSPAGPQWRFGIGGVPMRVIERPYIKTAIAPAGNVDAERNTTPYFWMLDGSRLKTTYVSPPDPANSSTLVNVRTHHFWFYHRPSRTLSIPDGTIAEYDAQGRLTTIRDVVDESGTNVVTLEWLTDGQQRTTGLEVTQSLGNGQSRLVSIQFDPDAGLPASMSYDGRTWTYHYNARKLLEEVELPLGAGAPGWRFEYSGEPFSTDKLTRVTTPQGGVVTYEYADREFSFGGTPATFNVLDARRTYDDNTRLLGEWKFMHFANASGGTDVTEVTLPSQTKVTYTYGTYSNPNALAGMWQLRFRTVHSPAGNPIEQEERQYTALLRAARSEQPWGVPQLARRLVTRGGRTYSTAYTYSSRTLPNFHEFHNPITITERGPTGVVERTRRLTYRHLIDDAYVLGLPATESISVGGMTLSKSWGYNASTGFLVSQTIYGITTTFGADAFGNVAEAVRGNGKSSSFTYSWGTLRNTTTPGVVIERAINPDGTVASETVAGRTTTYQYGDPLGRRTRVEPPGPSNPTTITYDDANRTVTTRRGGSVLTTTADGFGRPIEAVDGVGTRTRTVYDAEGRKTYQSYAFTNTDVGTAFTYDSLGRVTAEINPDGTRRTRTYDDATNSVIVRDEEDRQTRLSYRAFGHPDDARLIKVVGADQQTWTYRYDAIGNLTQVVPPTGPRRTWLWNTSGLLTSETHPESGTVRYTQYDAAGVLKRKVDANGAEFIFEHDGNDRVTQITAGTHVTNVVYEIGSDNRVSVNNGSVATTFDYDAAGRLAHRRDTIGAHVFDSQYAYDGNDRLTAITYPSGRVIGYERADAEGRITRVFEAAANRDYGFGFTYHPSGALATYTAGNGLSTAITYDPSRYWVHGITAGPLQLTYDDYDGTGNVLRIGDSRPGYTQSFTYDALHRLVAATGPYGSSGYAYDALGNRRTSSGTTYVYDSATLRLTAQNGRSFGYDSNGNLISEPGRTYTYTPENWLATVNGTQAAYLYDADGWRAKKTAADDATFHLRGPSGELLTEWHDLGATARARDYVYAGTRLISAIDKPVTSATCGGTAIPDGSPTTINVPPGGTASFTFQGSACRTVSASISASTIPNCTVFYHKLRIHNPDGSVLASYNGVCAGDIVRAVLPTSGIYTVSVFACCDYSGTVTVRVYDVVDVSGPITFGQAVNVTLDTPGQRGYWTFTGSQNRRVSAMINATDLYACGPYNSFSLVSGASPDGTVIGTTGFDGLCAGVLIGPVTLPSTGPYTVVVDPYLSHTGQVALTVYDVVDDTGPVTVDGPAVSATLHNPGERGLWTFNGTTGQRVRGAVNMSTTAWCSIYNSFGILKPDGSPLGTQWDMCAGAVTPELTLPSDGIYTLLVDPMGSSTGDVTARVIGPSSVLVNGTSPPTIVTVAPSTVVSVQVLGRPGNPQDWVALQTVGGNDFYPITYQTVPTSGAPLSFTMPSTPGDYEFRFYLTGWYNRLATSTVVRVQ